MSYNTHTVLTAATYWCCNSAFLKFCNSLWMKQPHPLLIQVKTWKWLEIRLPQLLHNVCLSPTLSLEENHAINVVGIQRVKQQHGILLHICVCKVCVYVRVTWHNNWAHCFEPLANAISSQCLQKGAVKTTSILSRPHS